MDNNRIAPVEYCINCGKEFQQYSNRIAPVDFCSYNCMLRYEQNSIEEQREYDAEYFIKQQEN